MRHPLHALAVLTFQTDQSMATLAARMVDRGLLARAEGPGRAIHHRITREGERTRLEGSTILDGVFAESIGRLTDDERSALYDLVVRALG